MFCCVNFGRSAIAENKQPPPVFLQDRNMISHNNYGLGNVVLNACMCINPAYRSIERIVHDIKRVHTYHQEIV